MKGHTYSKRTLVRPMNEAAALARPMLANGIRGCSSRRVLRAERNEARNAGVRGALFFSPRMGGTVGITIKPRRYT